MRISLTIAKLATALFLLAGINGCGRGNQVSQTVVVTLPQIIVYNKGFWPVWISPDFQHVATCDGHSIAIDGVAGPTFPDTRIPTVLWLPDSTRCFYAIHDRFTSSLFMGNQNLGTFLNSDFTISDDGKRWAVWGWRSTPKNTPGPFVLFVDGSELKSPEISSARFAPGQHDLYFKVEGKWQSENGLPAADPIAKQLEAKPIALTAATPKTYPLFDLPPPAPAPGVNPQFAGPAVTSAKPIPFQLTAKVHHEPMRHWHELYVNGEHIGDFDEILRRFPVSTSMSEWYYVAADGTVTLYALRNNDIVRLVIHP
jgi:hypothetical protein